MLSKSCSNSRTMVLLLSLIAMAALTLTMTDGAYGQIVRGSQTIKNVGGVDAQGLKIVGKGDKAVQTKFTAATAYYPGTRNKIWKGKNIVPPAQEFTWLEADLFGGSDGVDSDEKARIEYRIVPVPNFKWRSVGINANKSYFTDEDDAKILNSVQLLATVKGIDFMGNVATVSITNTKKVPVIVSNLVIRSDNTQPLDSPDPYDPDGVIVDVEPPFILLPGETFEKSFDVSDPDLAVSIEDTVALVSDPSDPYDESLMVNDMLPKTIETSLSDPGLDVSIEDTIAPDFDPSDPYDESFVANDLSVAANRENPGFSASLPPPNDDDFWASAIGFPFTLAAPPTIASSSTTTATSPLMQNCTLLPTGDIWTSIRWRG